MRNGPERRAVRNSRRGGAIRVLQCAMLSVPTLWTVFVINFLAVGLIWAYVVRSYPNLEAARFWTASCFTAAAGAVLAMLRHRGGGLAAAAACRRRRDDFRRLPRRHGRQAVLWPAGLLARHHPDHGTELRRPDLLHRRLRQHVDAGAGLLDRPVAAAGDDAEAAAVAAAGPRQSRRASRRHRRRADHRHLCRQGGGRPGRRRLRVHATRIWRTRC